MISVFASSSVSSSRYKHVRSETSEREKREETYPDAFELLSYVEEAGVVNSELHDLLLVLSSHLHRSRGYIGAGDGGGGLHLSGLPLLDATCRILYGEENESYESVLTDYTRILRKSCCITERVQYRETKERQESSCMRHINYKKVKKKTPTTPQTFIKVYIHIQCSNITETSRVITVESTKTRGRCGDTSKTALPGKLPSW
jgi:hypothetical protein